MAHKVVFRPAAKSDLRALYNYISEQAGRTVAGGYIDRIQGACMALATHPERGSARDDLFPGIRIVGFERRVSIVFVVEPTLVRIVRILYGGRDYPKEW